MMKEWKPGDYILSNSSSSSVQISRKKARVVTVKEKKENRVKADKVEEATDSKTNNIVVWAAAMLKTLHGNATQEADS